MTLSLVTAAAIAWAVVAGAPLAWAMRGRDGHLGRFLYDAAACGTALTAAVMVGWVWFGPFGLAAGIVIAVVASVVAVVLGARGPRRPLPVRVRPLDAVFLVALVAAFALRTKVSNNILWTNDMGGYVNWANEFARSDVWTATFPPSFPALLALPSKLGGPDATVLILPALGLLLVAGIARLTGLLRLPWWARVGAVALAVVSPHLIWYSTFDASEDLQAPLFVFTAVLLVRTWQAPARLRGAFPAVVIATAVASTTLALNRGTALTFVPTYLFVLAAAWLPAWRSRGTAIGWWAGASIAGIGVGWVYGVSRIPGYFVRAQLAEFVPASILDPANAHGLLQGGVGAVAWGLFSAVVVLIGVLATRRGRRKPRAVQRFRGAVWWPLPMTALLAVTEFAVLYVLSTPNGELRNILQRIGLGLLAVALLGLVVPLAVRGVRGVFALWGGSVIVTVLGLQSLRFGAAVPHLNYLYWDRYLVSEYLPLVIVLSASGVAGLVVTVANRLPRGAIRWSARRVLAPAVALVVVAGATYLWYPQTSIQQRGALYDGAFAFTSQIAAEAPASRPVVWLTTDPTMDVKGVFPNGSWSIGSALDDSFGLTVVNRPFTAPFGADPVIADATVAPVTSCAAGGIATAVVWWPAGTTLTPPSGDLVWQQLGTVTGSIEVMHQDIAPAGWSFTPARAAVFSVTDPDWTPATCPR